MRPSLFVTLHRQWLPIEYSIQGFFFLLFLGTSNTCSVFSRYTNQECPCINDNPPVEDIFFKRNQDVLHKMIDLYRMSSRKINHNAGDRDPGNKIQSLSRSAQSQWLLLPTMPALNEVSGSSDQIFLPAIR